MKITLIAWILCLLAYSGYTQEEATPKTLKLEPKAWRVTCRVKEAGGHVVILELKNISQEHQKTWFVDAYSEWYLRARDSEGKSLARTVGMPEQVRGYAGSVKGRGVPPGGVVSEEVDLSKWFVLPAGGPFEVEAMHWLSFAEVHEPRPRKFPESHPKSLRSGWIIIEK